MSGSNQVKSRRSNAGRKSKWATHVQPKLETIRYWRRMNTKEDDIAEMLCVHRATFARYKNKYSDLRDVLKQDKQALAALYLNGLTKRATGYEYEDTVTTVIVDKDGKQKGDIQVQVFKKHVPPNTSALIFGMKNLDERWRDVQDHNHQGKIEYSVTHKASPALLEQMQAVLASEINRRRLAPPSVIDLIEGKDAIVSGANGNGNGNGKRKLVKEALKDLTL